MHRVGCRAEERGVVLPGPAPRRGALHLGLLVDAPGRGRSIAGRRPGLHRRSSYPLRPGAPRSASEGDRGADPPRGRTPPRPWDGPGARTTWSAAGSLSTAMPRHPRSRPRRSVVLNAAAGPRSRSPTWRARVSHVQTLPAGARPSYGRRRPLPGARRSSPQCRWAMPTGSRGGRSTPARPVLVGGRARQLAGTVTMDQIVVDCGPDADVSEGDDVVLIGSASRAQRTATQWADELGTISYEVLCAIGKRVVRVVVDSEHGVGALTGTGTGRVRRAPQPELGALAVGRSGGRGRPSCAGSAVAWGLQHRAVRRAEADAQTPTTISRCPTTSRTTSWTFPTADMSTQWSVARDRPSCSSTGSMLSGALWVHQLRDLAPTPPRGRSRPLGPRAVDLGRRRAEHRRSARRRWGRLASDLWAVLEALDVQESLLVGHSIGGMTVLRLALDRAGSKMRSRVGGMALVSTTAGPLVPLARVWPSARAAEHSAPWCSPPSGTVLSSLPSGDLRWWVSRMGFGADAEPALVRFVEQMHSSTSSRVFAELLPSLTAYDLSDRLGELDLPVVVVVGTHDRILPARHARRLAAGLGRAELWSSPVAVTSRCSSGPRSLPPARRVFGQARCQRRLSVAPGRFRRGV